MNGFIRYFANRRLRLLRWWHRHSSGDYLAMFDVIERQRVENAELRMVNEWQARALRNRDGVIEALKWEIQTMRNRQPVERMMGWWR